MRGFTISLPNRFRFILNRTMSWSQNLAAPLSRLLSTVTIVQSSTGKYSGSLLANWWLTSYPTLCLSCLSHCLFAQTLICVFRKGSRCSHSLCCCSDLPDADTCKYSNQLHSKSVYYLIKNYQTVLQCLWFSKSSHRNQIKEWLLCFSFHLNVLQTIWQFKYPVNETQLNETSGSGHYKATISLMCVYVGFVSHGSNTFVTLWASCVFSRQSIYLWHIMSWIIPKKISMTVVWHSGSVFHTIKGMIS